MIRLKQVAANVTEVSFQSGLTLLFSYETCVAFYHPLSGWVVSENIWSATTGKHLNQNTPVVAKDRIPYERFSRMLDEVTP